MAGPLSGIGGFTQTTQATQTQISQNSQQDIRESKPETPPASNRIQPQGAPLGEAQETEPNNQALSDPESFLAANDEAQYDSNAPRGSLLDIAV